ncbi:hypothetical protein Ddc_15929 [Ditylenchus destructor]|nr:hypothetical protein Ddc_15929 [Ditylenchus destructor]
MSRPRVYLRMQLDIFALFNRPELSRLSEANRHFNAIVKRYFATSPYSVLGYLHYLDGVWKWTATVSPYDYKNINIAHLGATAASMSNTQITQLPSSKFLRFGMSHFVFKSVSNAMDVLKAHNHVWEDGLLFVFMSRFLRSMEFANVVNTSKYLSIRVSGSLRMMSELIQGKCTHLMITDKFNIPTKQLPVNDIINYIFSKSRSNTEPIRVGIKTRYPPKFQFYEQIVNSIKQKFLETALPPTFVFVKLHNGDMDWPQAHDFTLDHPQCTRKLFFNIRERNTFTLFCMSNENGFVINFIYA